MNVAEEKFTRGLMQEPILRSPSSLRAADLIYRGLGTKYEPQEYTFEEIHWACLVLGKPFDHVRGKPCNY